MTPSCIWPFKQKKTAILRDCNTSPIRCYIVLHSLIRKSIYKTTNLFVKKKCIRIYISPDFFTYFLSSRVKPQNLQINRRGHLLPTSCEVLLACFETYYFSESSSDDNNSVINCWLSDSRLVTQETSGQTGLYIAPALVNTSCHWMKHFLFQFQLLKASLNVSSKHVATNFSNCI